MPKFHPLPIRYPHSRISLHARVHGIRMPIGPQGIYVGSAENGFQYSAQDVTGGNPRFTRTGLGPDSIAKEIAARTKRANLFRVYWVLVGLGFLFTSVAIPAAAVILLVAGLVGAYPVYRWNKERRTTRIFYDVDNDELVGRLALCNVAGESLSRSSRLWHIASETAVYNRKYQAGASALVGRVPTRASNRAFPGIETNIEYWSIQVGPVQLVFLPDQLLVRRGAQWWPLWYSEITVVDTATRFIERGPISTDTQVVDRTWRYTRKDGGPDLRFNNNHQIPVVLYGEVTLVGRNGDQLTLQTSSQDAARAVANALRELARIAAEGIVPAPIPPSRGPVAPHFTPKPPARQVISPPHAHHVHHTHPFAALPMAPDSRRQPVPPQAPQPAPPSNPQAQAQAVSAMRAVANGPSLRLPPPVPMFRPPADVRRSHAETPAKFLDGAEVLSVAGRIIRSPLTFVATNAAPHTDASTIVTSLPVGDAPRALPLPYWPRYTGADPDQRARYLDWMAGGRIDPGIAIGYVFLFFYGLERRVLLDGANVDAARLELTRLLDLYGDHKSFGHYASDFLAFTYLRDLRAFLAMNASNIEATLLPLLARSELARAGVAAWYHCKQQPLPAEYAAIFVRNMEFARRGAVVTRSADELLALFRIRYREAFGEGIVLEAAKRPLMIEYRPASATMQGHELTVSLPNIFKKSGQFSKILRVWNECVDALRASTAKKRGAKELDATAWAALPEDLRAEYDHPDQDTWDTMIAASPVLSSFRLTTLGVLAKLTGLDPSEKLTPSQLKRIGQRATDVGYALEPEPRLRTRSIDPSSEVLVWRMEASSVPDAHMHGGVTAMLSLSMTVALADGFFAPEEDAVLTSFLEEMFRLDEAMRVRIEALKQLVIRDPERIGHVAKTLRAQRSAADLEKIAAVLVAIAASDGFIAGAEEKALKRLYRELGLSPSDFATAIARTGARLERDKPIEVRATAKSDGVPIPPPPAATHLRLDQAAIDAIVADTKDVAAILAEVFESGEVEPASQSQPEAPASTDDDLPLTPAAPPRAAGATAKIAEELDVRYHAALEDLLAKPKWTTMEVRELGTRHRLMPGAILDTINTWSDETFGDYLIEEAEGWNVHRELVEVNA